MTKLCTIFALAVFAIAAVNGDTAPTLPTYAAGENHPTSTPKGTCTDAQQRFINDTLIRMKKCYSEIINTYLGAKNASFTCTKANDLKTKWHQQFINATSCYKEKRFNESLHFFYNLLNFTTSNSEFKDFVHHNGSACVSDIRIHTNRCIRTATGRQNDTQPNIFLLGQDNKEACREIVTLKNCVVDLMKSKNCDLTGSNFIGSLTNFVTKQFCNNPQQAKITKNSAGFTTANVILTTLAAIAFI